MPKIAKPNKHLAKGPSNFSLCDSFQTIYKSLFVNKWIKHLHKLESQTLEWKNNISTILCRESWASMFGRYRYQFCINDHVHVPKWEEILACVSNLACVLSSKNCAFASTYWHCPTCIQTKISILKPFLDPQPNHHYEPKTQIQTD